MEFVILCLSLPLVFSQITQVVIYGPDGGSSTMYANNNVQPLFSDTSSRFNCAVQPLYIYQQSPT